MITAARSFAERYVGFVNAGHYDQLASLFAPDASFLGPGGREFRGQEEIAAFYGTFLPTITPRIRLASLVEAGPHCVYELEAQVAGQTQYVLSAIDHVTLDDDGLATRFAVYTK